MKEHGHERTKNNANGRNALLYRQPAKRVWRLEVAWLCVYVAFGCWLLAHKVWSDGPWNEFVTRFVITSTVWMSTVCLSVGTFVAGMHVISEWRREWAGMWPFLINGILLALFAWWGVQLLLQMLR